MTWQCSKDKITPSNNNKVIFSSDSFSVEKAKYIPTIKKTSAINNKWVIFASYCSPRNQVNFDSSSVRIIFEGSSRLTTAGDYSINIDSTSLSSNQVYISFFKEFYGTCECNLTYKGHALSGKVRVSINSDGQVHLIYKDLTAITSESGFGAGIKDTVKNIFISGDIICY